MKKSVTYIIALIFTCAIAFSAVGCKRDDKEVGSRYALSGKNSSLADGSDDSSDGSGESVSVSEKSDGSNGKTGNGSDAASISGTAEAELPEDWYEPGTPSVKPSLNGSAQAKPSSPSGSSSSSEKSDGNKDGTNKGDTPSSPSSSSGAWKSDTLLSSLPSGFK